MIKLQPVGYEALILRYHLDTIPHWHCSLVAIDSHIQKIEQRGDVIYEIYSKKYAIEDKRKKYFEFLSDEEVGLMVKSVII